MGTAGDFVIFDPDMRWLPSDVVIVAVDGQVEVTGRLALRADADDDTHVLNDGDQVYGKAISIQRTLGSIS